MFITKVSSISRTSNPSFLNKDLPWKKVGTCAGSIEAFKNIYGAKKVHAVCQRYGLTYLEKKKEPLKLEYRRKFQVGLNDISYDDLSIFVTKLKKRESLTKVEVDLAKALGIDKINCIKQFEQISQLPASLFNELLKTYQTIVSSYNIVQFVPLDIAYITGVPHCYLEHGFINFRKGRSFEDEERVRLYDELSQLGPEEQTRYCEILSKILVKKHLYYENASTNDRNMGMLIPGLKDRLGNATWYRVEELMDSGLGKFGYRLVPATEDYAEEMPELLLFRSSASLPTAVDCFTSYLSDLNIAPPGYISRYACREQEARWISDSTSKPSRKNRPLLITGHSLGASNIQIAFLNLQKRGIWPKRKITLELFDSPAIKNQDARNFAGWIDSQKIEEPFLINYYVSKGDPVPIAGYVLGSSYLGNYIKSPLVQASVRKLSLKEGVTDPSILGLTAHARIYFRGKADKDYNSVKLTIEQYDQEKKWVRVTANIARIGAALVFWSTLGLLGSLKRIFVGRQHHDALIVQLFKDTFKCGKNKTN